MAFRITRAERCAGVSLIFFVLTATLQAESPPPDYFARHDDYHDVQISPDGKHLAMTFMSEGQIRLVIVDRATMQPKTAIKATNEGSIDRFFWANNQRILYQPSFPRPFLEQPALSASAFGVDIDGSQHDRVYGHGVRGTHRSHNSSSFDLLSVLHSDDDHILITERPHRRGHNPVVYRFNVYTGQKFLVSKLPLRVAQAIVDRNDQLRLAYGANDQEELMLFQLDEASGNWTELALQGITPSSLRAPEFGAATHSVFLKATRSGENRRTLFRMTLPDGQLEAVLSHPDVDTDDLVRDLASYRVFAARLEPGKPEYHYFDSDSDELTDQHRFLQRQFSGQEAVLTSQSRTGEQWIVKVHSDTNPGKFFLFEPNKRRLTPLVSTRSHVQAANGFPMQPVKLAARDGHPLHGYITLPSRQGKELKTKSALVVMPHGGPIRRDHWRYNRDTQFLASRGFAVLQINYRGGSGYGIGHQEAGYLQWGGILIDDIIDATRYAVKAGLADEQRICAYGSSFGAYAALMTAAKAPDLIQCVISYAGISDLVTLHQDVTDTDDEWTKSWYEKRLGSDLEMLKRYSPVNHAANLQAPVLAVHGRQDWQVRMRQANQLKSALDRADKPVELVVFETEGHRLWKPEHRADFYRKMESFLCTHLGCE